MKITKAKVDKAIASLPKLKLAQECVHHWEAAKKQDPETFASKEVTQIELVDGVYEITSRPKDLQKRLVS